MSLITIFKLYLAAINNADCVNHLKHFEYFDSNAWYFNHGLEMATEGNGQMEWDAKEAHLKKMPEIN